MHTYTREIRTYSDIMANYRNHQNGTQHDADINNSQTNNTNSERKIQRKTERKNLLTDYSGKLRMVYGYYCFNLLCFVFVYAQSGVSQKTIFGSPSLKKTAVYRIELSHTLMNTTFDFIPLIRTFVMRSLILFRYCKCVYVCAFAPGGI